MSDLLSISNLSITFHTEDGKIKASNDINLKLVEGKTLGLIGETGCGKSVLGLSIMRLLPRNTTIEGNIYYQGQDILKLNEDEMRLLRGKEIALIPQSPSTSLNPVLRIGTQIIEVLQLHKKLSKEKSQETAVDLLRFLRVPEPEKRVKQYPHQLSGGMKQRVLAAMGTACNPFLIIADEPTKGLDSLTKRQMVEVLRQLSKETGVTILLITHDLKIANDLCDHIAVMYAGEIVEYGDIEQVMGSPKHPYTKGLLSSLPDHGLKPIPGTSPSFLDLPSGCKFHPRCMTARDICAKQQPPLVNINGSQVRCMFVDQSGEFEESLYNRGLKKESVICS